MLILALELQDYTFGFAGINYLWTELNGFPRDVSLLFGPAIIFYLKSQINSAFKLSKKHLTHLIPWVMVFLIQIPFFLQGTLSVQELHQSLFFEIFEYVEWGLTICSYFYYFFKSIELYKSYKKWTVEEYSNTEQISFTWYRNFLYLMIIWVGFKVLFTIIDFFINLDYFDDWWWNLALATTAVYVGLQGYAQKQPRQIAFKYIETSTKVASKTTDPELIKLAERLENIMNTERLFLQAEINLRDLSKHLNTRTNQLSGSINLIFEKNFNDYINERRIQEFENLVNSGKTENLTLLSLAYDSGFNSKATFNRAFKKLRGISPREFINQFKS